MPRLLCSLCATRNAISGSTSRSTNLNLRNRAISSSCIVGHTTASSDLETERESARKRAWYLEDSSSSGSSSGHPPVPQNHSHQPRFTTYNPLSTLPLPLAPSSPPRPLPSNAPRYFSALHAFLTTSTDVIDPSSVVFLHTPSARAVRETEEELGVGGTGARWDWVVVAVIRGRGKGVVGRAERAVRIWLKDNPIPELSTSASPRRMPRVEAETDWSLIPIGQSGTCINLFTQEGRDKWDLEDLFGE